MEYKSRAKNRKIKRYILQSFQLMKFKWIHLSLWGKLSSTGAIVLALSCLATWVTSTDGTLSWNAFSALAGRVWITFILISLGVLFLIFSINKKEKIKLGTDLNFRDYNAIIMSWILTIILAIHAYIFVWWFQSFSSTVKIGNGAIFALIWWLFLMSWWFVLKKEIHLHNKWLIFTDAEGKTETEIMDENMRLPF